MAQRAGGPPEGGTQAGAWLGAGLGVGVARAASFFRTNLGWTLEEVSASDATHQWAALRTSRGPDQRPYDYFVDS